MILPMLLPPPSCTSPTHTHNTHVNAQHNAHNAATRRHLPLLHHGWHCCLLHQHLLCPRLPHTRKAGHLAGERQGLRANMFSRAAVHAVQLIVAHTKQGRITSMLWLTWSMSLHPNSKPSGHQHTSVHLSCLLLSTQLTATLTTTTTTASITSITTGQAGEPQCSASEPCAQHKHQPGWHWHHTGGPAGIRCAC